MLRVKYGWAGEGKYSALLGMIGKEEFCELDLNLNQNKGSVALDLGFSFDELTEFINYLTNDCGLLINNDGKITTAEIQELFEAVDSERQKARERKRLAEERRTKPEQKNNSDENSGSSAKVRRTFPQSKIKESKVKESKEEPIGADALGEEPSLGFNMEATEELIMNKWNEFAKAKQLPVIISLSSKRKKKIRARLKEKLFDFDNILKSASEQSFLLGENDREWKMDFDWLIYDDNNYKKVLEIKYPTKKKTNKNNQGNSERYGNVGS